VSAKCRSTKRHFDRQGKAFDRLEAIQAAPPDPARLYTPTAVIRCTCGGYVLTSNAAPTFASGKRSRRPLAQQRRRG
jgi:hypothetical protein